MNIRNILLFLIFTSLHSSAIAQFFCPNGVTNVTNELDLIIDVETNQISFDLSCDPCSYPDGGDACVCARNCVNTEYEDCYQACSQEFGSVAIAYCRNECALSYGYANWAEYQACIPACGVAENPKIKNIERFAYHYRLWWTHGLTSSQFGNPDEVVTSDVIIGTIPKIVHNSAEDFGNQSISYCYSYEVFIQYDDGTCCRYRGAGCFDKG